MRTTIIIWGLNDFLKILNVVEDVNHARLFKKAMLLVIQRLKPICLVYKQKESDQLLL